MQTKPIPAQPVDRTGRWLATLTRWVLAHKRLVAVSAKRPHDGSLVSSRGRRRLLPWEVSGPPARH